MKYPDKLFCKDCDDRVFVKEAVYAVGDRIDPRDSALACRNCGSARLSEAEFCNEHKCWYGEDGCPTCAFVEDPDVTLNALKHLLRACKNPQYGIPKTFLRVMLPPYLHQYIGDTPLPEWVEG